MFLSSGRVCTILVCSLIFLFSHKTLAVTLSIADNIELRELNDKRLGDGFFSGAFSSYKNIQLSKGRHTLLIKYKDVYEDLDFAEERLIESELFIVKFTLVDQQQLKLFTPKIKDLLAAERFSQSPEIILVDENNSALVLQLEKYNDYKLAKQVEKVVTALPVNGVVIKAAEKPQKTTKLDVASQESITYKGNEQAFNQQVLTHVNSLPMLKYWWKKASAQDKEDFILHIKGE